jgi:hypothetical protein
LLLPLLLPPLLLLLLLLPILPLQLFWFIPSRMLWRVTFERMNDALSDEEAAQVGTERIQQYCMDPQ